jgi:hypothetical protein
MLSFPSSQSLRSSYLYLEWGVHLRATNRTQRVTTLLRLRFPLSLTARTGWFNSKAQTGNERHRNSQSTTKIQDQSSLVKQGCKNGGERLMEDNSTRPMRHLDCKVIVNLQYNATA